MRDETTTHAINVINSTFLDHRKKVKVIGMVKNFSKGQNAQFTGDNWIDKRLLWPFYLEFLEKHPERKFYNKPTKTFNGIEFGLWLDPTKKSIGRNRLFEWLHEMGYFVNGNNPSAEMIAKGWMLQVVGQRINLKTPLFTLS